MPHFDRIHVIGFEAQVRYAGEADWLTLRVTRQWSEIEQALTARKHSLDRLGRRPAETRVKIVDHSAST